MKYLSIFIRVALLALGQSLDCHTASEVSLMDMGKSMYNHNKAQQSNKPCAYFLEYTVYQLRRLHSVQLFLPPCCLVLLWQKNSNGIQILPGRVIHIILMTFHRVMKFNAKWQMLSEIVECLTFAIQQSECRGDAAKTFKNGVRLIV